MSRRNTNSQVHDHVQAVMDEMGESDPKTAVRKKARKRLGEFAALFETPPFDLKALASCFGLLWSDEDPVFSEDSEIVPQRDGRVELRVNANRPVTRQRFSIAHELGHTLFPDYQFSVRCRKANDQRWTEDDFLETLCDVAASEFMFPLPWFADSLGSMNWTGEGFVKLADEYKASREATSRRLVEISNRPLIAVYLSWKLKPSEILQLKRDSRQPLLFPGMSKPDPELKLRVDYTIRNDPYVRSGGPHIPQHKSLPMEGLIHEAALTQSAAQGMVELEAAGKRIFFNAIVSPIYTEFFRSDNGCSVVAILQPA